MQNSFYYKELLSIIHRSGGNKMKITDEAKEVLKETMESNDCDCLKAEL